MTERAVPSRYQQAAIAHVVVSGAKEALDFYADAFGAEELFRIADADATVLHAEISIEGSVVMVGDANGIFHPPDVLDGTTVALHVFVRDVEALYRRALDAGAVSVQEPIDMFHGDREVILRDPFGHIWVLLEHREDLSIGELVRRGAALVNGDG